ncbi:hypothetical protein FRC19_000212 [Serendipita sp. 401]|nr:hypothetical protein FRC16_003524 [Serendipita sp. 398]KAG8828824.1 hypothetical protein FRC19_000212 [Serendipita sp. 401]
MPSLPILVSLMVSRERNKRSDDNADDNFQPLENDERPPPDHRIDMQQDVEENVTPDDETVVAPVRPPRRRRHITAANRIIVKKPLGFFGRILQAIRRFIFEPDKKLEEGYSPKYRYLPILSGVIVPFSILLEVPGLTEHWYNRTDGTRVVEYRENPAILNAGLGLSIASALLANICLIMRFLERRIKSATIAAICFLLIHDIINIIALAIFGIAHAVDDGFTYSQAYWVTLASTIVSLVVTVTLLIDYATTPNFVKSGSGLTRKQRSLVIIVMILFAYLGFGALIYCFMMDIRFLDGLYFSVCSSLTIGFGDIAPNKASAQVFSIFYNTFGILNTGIAIAIARETIIEAFQQSYRNRKHALAMRRKLHREVHAKHHAAKHSAWLASHKLNENLPDKINIPVSSAPPTPPPEISETTEKHAESKPGSPSEKEAGAGAGEKPSAGEEQKGKPEMGRSSTNTSSRSKNVEPSTQNKDPLDVAEDQREETEEEVQKLGQNMVSGFDDEEKEYIEFRQSMIKEEQKEFKAKLLVSWGLFITFWVLGGLIFHLSEGWSYGLAIYFCFTAFSTIGYGDVAPKTGPGRVCFIAWSLLGVGTMTILVSVLSEAFQSRYSTVIHNGLFDKAMRSYQNKTHSERQASPPETPSYNTNAMTQGERKEALEETKTEIANIPPKIIAQAKAFHAHLQFVLTNSSQEKPPPGLQRALDDLMEEEKMNEELRKEVLQDGEARRALFMMSFERTLKKMVENAEKLSKLIEEQESLEKGLKQEDEEDGLEDEDEFSQSPEDARVSDNREEPESAGDDTGRGGSKSGRANWLKLRSSLFATRLHPSSYTNRRPYLHTDGSQSEPHVIPEEEEETANSPGNSPDGSKADSHRKGKRTRQGSQLNSVRFADNPYEE